LKSEEILACFSLCFLQSLLGSEAVNIFSAIARPLIVLIALIALIVGMRELAQQPKACLACQPEYLLLGYESSGSERKKTGESESEYLLQGRGCTGQGHQTFSLSVLLSGHWPPTR